MEKPITYESKSNFDKLAELTQGKKINVSQEIKNQIIGKFLHEYAQPDKTQSEIVKDLITEYTDLDVCEILRPHADLSRE